MGNVAKDKSRAVDELPQACADETAAVEFLERQRWGNDPCCPRCGSVNVYKMRGRGTGGRSHRFLWRCRECTRQYTVRIGTVFEDSKIPLRHWCQAFWMACASKKGVSALQIKRMTGLSYPSALFMMHRIRWAMADDEATQPKLGGDGITVEVDETYVGGKPRYHQKGGQKWADRKVPVVAMVERGGKVRARTLPRVTHKNLRAVVLENVDTRSRLMTDEHAAYKPPGAIYASHETVKHSAGEYARGDVSINTAESFFANLKRGIYGTFHHVSRRHLHRYVNEFEFRHNTRHEDDGERTRLAIRAAEGKRLRYAHGPC